MYDIAEALQRSQKDLGQARFLQTIISRVYALPLQKNAERRGFEPRIRFRRIRTFQARSFNHSDTSPVTLSFGAAKVKRIPDIALVF